MASHLSYFLHKASCDGIWPAPVRSLFRVDLFPAVFLHGIAGISLRFWSDETAECNGDQPLLLEYRAGIRGIVGSFDIVDRTLFHSTLMIPNCD